MALRVAGGGDAEFVVGPDVADQVRGVVETALGGGEVFLASRGIAAQGDDVLDARVIQALQHAVQFLDGLADAGEVGHDLYARRLLGLHRNLLGEVAGRAARAVGHRYEVGAVGGEFGHCVQYGGDAIGVARREKLEGYGAPLLEHFAYLQNLSVVPPVLLPPS